MVRCPGDLLLDRTAFDDLCARVLRAVDAFHAANPTLPGMPREDLRQKLPADVRPAAFSRVLDELAGRAGWRPETAWSAGPAVARATA